jgi:hypothetical protein
MENIAQKLAELSFEYLVAARLSLINFDVPKEQRVRKATEFFLNSIKAHKNPMNLRAFAEFLHEQELVNEAVHYYRQILSMEVNFTEVEKIAYEKDITLAKEFLNSKEL